MVACTATSCPGCTPTGDAGACVEPNARAGEWGLQPLILAGAGRTLTIIAAQADMHAILEFRGPPGGGTIGKSTILHDLKDLTFHAGGAEHCPPLCLPIDPGWQRRAILDLPNSQHIHFRTRDYPHVFHAYQLLQCPACRHVSRV
jgi:hypothetical protein